MESKKVLWHTRLLMFLLVFQILLSGQLLFSHFFSGALMGLFHDICIWTSPFIGLIGLLVLFRVNKFFDLSDLRKGERLEYLDSQRHDFINHLQTIIGFIQLQKTPAALTYAREVVWDLTKGSLQGQTTEETLKALLIGITEHAARRGVSVRFTLCPQSLDKIPVPAPNLNRLVGNLMHNAIDAVECLEEAHCQVYFSLELREQEWHFEVRNPGPPIPPAILEKIFTPGFSTKAQSGRGQGLNIVQNITNAYGGRLFVESNAEVGTRFEVIIPQSNKD